MAVGREGKPLLPAGVMHTKVGRLRSPVTCSEPDNPDSPLMFMCQSRGADIVCMTACVVFPWEHCLG